MEPIDLRSANAILDRLTYITPRRHLLYVTDATVGSDGDFFSLPHTFEHLTCFLPGMLALGAATLRMRRLPICGLHRALHKHAGLSTPIHPLDSLQTRLSSPRDPHPMMGHSGMVYGQHTSRGGRRAVRVGIPRACDRWNRY